MAEELDDYSKCLLVGSKTFPLQLSERELTALFDTQAFKNLRRQACIHVAAILTRLSDPKTSIDDIRCLQGEFRALQWLIRSKQQLISEFQQKENIERKPGDVRENARRLTTLLDGKEIENGQE